MIGGTAGFLQMMNGDIAGDHEEEIGRDPRKRAGQIQYGEVIGKEEGRDAACKQFHKAGGHGGRAVSESLYAVAPDGKRAKGENEDSLDE